MLMRWHHVGEILQAFENDTDTIIFTFRYTGSVSENYIEFYREWRLKELAAQRYNVECGGITVPGIGHVATDRQSQSMITGALTYVTMVSAQTIDWKLTDGTFVTITLPQVQELASAVGGHVQTCFAHEHTLKQMITHASTDDDIHSVDISFGWP